MKGKPKSEAWKTAARASWTPERKAKARLRLSKPPAEVKERKRLWAVWSAMHKRCANPNAREFKHYGGRGITVCKRWNTFDNFRADMGPRPKGMMIERINNDGNYEPTNCKWSTSAEQHRNMRTNRRVLIDGKSVLLRDVCAQIGIPFDVARARLRLGWSIERSLTVAVKQTPHQGIAEMCRLRGIPYSAVLKRLSAGWNLEKALSHPLRADKRRRQ